MRNFVKQFFELEDSGAAAEIPAKIIRKTRRAVFVEFAGQKVWLRKSDVRFNREQIILPEWLWQQKFGSRINDDYIYKTCIISRQK